MQSASDAAPESTASETVPATMPAAASEKEMSTDSSSPEGEEEPQYLSPRALTMLSISLMLVILLVTLDASILATAIPQITDHFHTIADIGWYASAYMLTNASLQPLTGKVFTYFSLKLSFLAFIGVFELGSLICAVATSSKMLIIGRAIAGMGASGLMNGLLTILAISASPTVRPTLMGIFISMGGAGQLIGPLIGGALTEHVSWRWCFYINLPVGAVTIVATAFISFPPYKARKTSWTFRDVVHDFDITGFTLFAPACIMLLLALEWGGSTYSWSSATVLGLLCGSAATFAVFIAWEYRQGEAAMIPLSLIRKRVVYSSLIVSLFTLGGLLVYVYYLPLWFQIIKAASPTKSGVYILPLFGSQIFTAIAVGAITSIVGYLTPFSMAGNALITISAGLASTLTVHAGAGKWIGYQILNGVGRGLAMQQAIQAVQAVVSPSMIPTATATVTFAQTFGAALFTSLGQTTFLNLLGPALHQYAPDVDAQVVINTGATNYLASLPKNSVTRHGVLLAYNQAITRTFYLAVGCAAAAFVASIGIGKTKVQTRKEKKAKQAQLADEEKARNSEVQPGRTTE